MKLFTLFCSILVSVTCISQNAGQPDFSFGYQGYAMHSIALIDNSTSMALQSTGKILVTSVSSDLVSSLTRFNADGSVDENFGTNGNVAISVVNSAFISVNSVRVMHDDRIVVGFTMGDNNFMSYYGCVRFMPDGTPDESFGIAGIRITPVEPAAVLGGMYGIALQPDGQVISYGVTSSPTNAEIVLFRLGVDGVFDDDFGVNGFSYVGFTSVGDFPTRVIFTEDDKILVAGYSEIPSGGPLDPAYNDVGLARLDMNGTLDPDFGDDGIFSENLSDDGDSFRDVIVLDDGSIYAAGYIADATPSTDDGFLDYLLCRITADGNFDTTFDEDGWMRMDLAQSNDVLSSLLMDEDGKLLLIGTSQSGATDGYSMIRCNQDGIPDDTFGQTGSNGRVWDTENTHMAYMVQGLIQPDGRILACGYISGNASVNIFLARYWETIPDMIEERNSLNLSIYPNPTADYLRLDSPGALSNSTILIYDTSGKIVMTRSIGPSGAIDVHALPAGSYTLVIGKRTARFVKK